MDNRPKLPPPALSTCALPIRPKRPLTPYNIFFQHQRRKLLDQVRNGNKKGIGCAGLARTVIARWKATPQRARQEFVDLSKADRARYDDQMLVWRYRMSVQTRLNKRRAVQTDQDEENLIRGATPHNPSISSPTSSKVPREEQAGNGLQANLGSTCTLDSVSQDSLTALNTSQDGDHGEAIGTLSGKTERCLLEPRQVFISVTADGIGKTSARFSNTPVALDELAAQLGDEGITDLINLFRLAKKVDEPKPCFAP